LLSAHLDIALKRESNRFMASTGLLAGQTALITGGSRGIGKALCDVFAREGADVAFLYASNHEAAADTVRLIESHGRKARALAISVTDGPAIKAAVKDLVNDWGSLTILVNNAAINRADSFVTTRESSWMDVINTNVHSLFYVTKPVLKQMMRQRQGAILNITSIGAIRALPTSVHYATSKAAVIGFTKCLCREAAPFGVKVNAIAAGIFDTDLGHSLPEQFNALYTQWCPQQRLGQPAELAEMAAFMVSGRNTYMAGEVITIDGGSVV
jgi:3-oxoacyl-[acyl-carrier protein] reductase